jgi:hypothetical protein
LFCDNDSNYVIRCTECDHIQVAFKNLALTFYPVDFDGFCDCLETVYKAVADTPENSSRNLAIPMPYDGVQLLLNKSELNQLYQMLNEANTELRSLELISLFKNH